MSDFRPHQEYIGALPLGGNVRIQLDVSSDRFSEIKLLMKRTGSETYKELFNNAMTLLKWSVDQKSEGRSLFSVDESKDSWMELQMPALEHAVPPKAEQMPPAEDSAQQKVRGAA